jgi:hypothetical protein
MWGPSEPLDEASRCRYRAYALTGVGIAAFASVLLGFRVSVSCNPLSLDDLYCLVVVYSTLAVLVALLYLALAMAKAWWSNKTASPWSRVAWLVLAVFLFPYAVILYYWFPYRRFVAGTIRTAAPARQDGSALFAGEESCLHAVMEVPFTPELEKKLTDLAGLSGVPAAELVQEAVAGYVDHVAEVRATLDARYDDLKSGRIQPIDGEEVRRQMKARTQAQRDRRR